MQKSKNKPLSIVIIAILAFSLAISFNSLANAAGTYTYPIPGHPGDGYNLATYTAIQQGMNFPPSIADMNASANRLLFWTRFQDQVNTHVFIVTAPSPVGVGQDCNIVMFNPEVPDNTGSIVAGYTLRYYYTFTVEKPDGTIQNFPQTTTPSYSSWSMNEIVTYGGQTVFGSDSTGSTYMTYIPDTAGNYTFTVHFLQQTVDYNATTGVSTDWTGITLLGSNYTTTLVVQQQPVSLTGLTAPSYSPVPTSYWTRPINQQNIEWWAIASNWLADEHDFNQGGSQNALQTDGTAPNSPHILWTTPEEDSGILGDSDTTRLGNSFNTGSQYQPRLTPPTYGGEGPIIMYGRLYYSPDLYTSGYSELFNCLNLKTGQLEYTVNTTAVTGAQNRPAFGYYYSQDDVNEHGIQNTGWLFTSSYTVGYQPEYGYAELHLQNAPTGYEIDGPAGENLRYSAVNVGNATTGPIYNLLQWNSSKVIPMISSGATPSTTWYEANVPITPTATSLNPYWNGTQWSTVSNVTALGEGLSASPSYDWNISMPSAFNSAATGAITIAGVSLGNFLWGYNGTWATGTSAPQYTYADNVTVWAINLALNANEQPAGNLLYMTTIATDTMDTPAQDNQNIMFEHADPISDVFIAIEVPSQTFYVWNMTTGHLMFTTDSQAATITPYGYYTWPSLISGTQVKTAYGMLYTGGYSGSISAYALNSSTTGASNVMPVWRTPIIPAGTAGVIKSSPGMMGMIADGYVYIGCHEHSAETPLEAGNDVRCLNATTGQEIWTLSGWAYPSTFAVADGVMIYLNNYDESIYAIAQGPTQTTVTAPDVASTVGTPVVIRGTVMDISPGTQQSTIKLDFPNGVPAVSDASMGQWMAYVYEQQAEPSNATGVQVNLSVLDSNGNYRSIGTATTDSSGMFTYAYAPTVAGSYTVYATFAGTNGYYGSSAESSFYATNAPATPVAPTATPTSIADTYFVPAIAGLFIVIIVVAIVLVLLILRKRP